MPQKGIKNDMTVLTILTVCARNGQNSQTVTSKNYIQMAHIKVIDGFKNTTGAISKKKVQGVNQLTITRQKEFHDPLTNEVCAVGPNEMYIQHLRDYEEHPLTTGEAKQRGKWSEACREALNIINDRSHPRYMELYHRWRAQLGLPKPCKKFPNFVRAVLANEI